MKKLLCVLLLMAIMPVWSGAQAPFQRHKTLVTFNLSDAVEKDTLNLAIPDQRGKGLPWLKVNTNYIGSVESPTLDSLTLRYREAIGPNVADTLGNSVFKTGDIYRGGAAAVSFSNFAWADSAWYHVILDMDGEAWEYIQVEANYQTIVPVEGRDSLAMRVFLNID